MASFRATFQGRGALPRPRRLGNRVTNVRTGRRQVGDDSGNGNVSSKLLITINHRATRVTNSGRRGITAPLCTFSGVCRPLGGTDRHLPPRFCPSLPAVTSPSLSWLLGTVLLRNIPLANGEHPPRRRHILCDATPVFTKVTS